jgi:predicted enzyme related to lactoylglutathione lyase
MLDAGGDPSWGPGPIFVTEDVSAFHAKHDGAYEITVPPFEIPGGFMSGFRDPGGNDIYVMDQRADG